MSGFNTKSLFNQDILSEKEYCPSSDLSKDKIRN